MFDIYKMVTDRIVQMIETSGKLPWHRPWIAVNGGKAAVNHRNGKPYSLLNQILLGEPGEYLTFKQALAEGGNVKKGEKSKVVVFWDWLDKKDEKGNLVIDPKTGKPEQVPFLKYYNVFSTDQCEGITPKYIKTDATVTMPGDSLATSEKAEGIVSGYISRSGVKLTVTESNQAYYQPSADKVVVPKLCQYSSVSEYYSTLFHELTHSTGHESRLNRIHDVAAFGSQEYSREELIAEIGASSLVNYCGMETADSFQNNAAYVQNWLKVLKGDSKLIVSASGKAEKAVALIIG